MPPRLNLFTNRDRANSFGGAALNYDTHRPRYPEQLIDDVVAPGVGRLVDVGAGTGIAAKQFIERGVDVLAVEPDTRMAHIAQAKGIPIEIAAFEQWEPAGRRFDRVVLAASFHWVDPAIALPKIRGILTNGGQLALIWNRLRPTRSSRAEFESIYRDYLDTDARGADGEPDRLTGLLSEAGFVVTHRRYPHDLHYSTRQWVDIAFTFSNHLTLVADKAAELHTKMAELIGPSGVWVGGTHWRFWQHRTARRRLPAGPCIFRKRLLSLIFRPGSADDHQHDVASRAAASAGPAYRPAGRT